jgi:hypothetical protein
MIYRVLWEARVSDRTFGRRGLFTFLPLLLGEGRGEGAKL